ncbi:MAG: fibronectin type III domain-containing protein, partial [Myxococcota bacterium]|nr:fibronectin type III domain-containing protein [Myxococcota bacterium]
MVLRFTVVVSGFDGSENLQVWASKSSDCTAAPDRGVGGSGSVVPTCWLVNQGFTAQTHAARTTLQFDVRVQDLVGLQNSPPYPANYVAQGPSACTAQPTFVAVPMTVNFVPINSGNGALLGTAFQYKISADLIGPPAPSGVGETVGDTLFIATWTLNTDTDTAGYDVFIDPIPGQEGNASSVTPDGSILVCSDGASSAATAQDAAADGLEGGDDGSTTDAAIVASSPDADCHYLNVAGSSGTQNSCTSTALAGGIVQDGGSVQQYDDAGNPIDGGASSGSGGLSTIPLPYLVNPGSTGVTVSDRSTNSYTVKGLKNNNWYNVVVAAVDNSGNVGPPSPEVCDFPALVNDFWTVYRQAGGGAGGGFCALEAVGEPVPCAAGIALVLVTGGLALRRRRKR